MTDKTTSVYPVTTILSYNKWQIPCIFLYTEIVYTTSLVRMDCLSVSEMNYLSVSEHATTRISGTDENITMECDRHASRLTKT